MSAINLDEAERLLAAATPGEWTTHPHPDADCECVSICAEPDPWGVREFSGGVVTAYLNAEANAAFIAYAHNAFPALLALARKAERMEAALAVPAVWSESETAALLKAYDDASRKHGFTETMFAVAATSLRLAQARAALGDTP